MKLQVVALVLLVLGAGSAGSAEEENPDGSDEDADSVVLPEVVVTATKRNAALRKLPASISAFNEDELRGASEMRDVLRRVPGVAHTEMQPELSRVSIRGIQIDSTGNTPEAAGLFIDDIPFNDPFINQVRPDLPLFDLEDIEVLKGPQGTLFGGSALSGAIRYKVRDAEVGTWELRSFGEYRRVTDGSPDRFAGAAANVPIGGEAALRLVGVRRLTGGTIDDLRNGVEDTDRLANTSARALIRWNVTDDWSVGVKGFFQQSNADDVPLAETTNGEFVRQRALRNAPYATRYGFGSLDVSYAMHRASIVSVSSFLQKKADLSNAFGERSLGVERLGQPIRLPTTADIHGFVQELRLVSADAPGDRWQWLTGAYFHNYHGVSTQQVFAKPAIPGGGGRLGVPELIRQLLELLPLPALQPSLLDFEADVTAREYALFGEVSRRLFDRWSVTLGMRGYRIRTDGTVVSSGALILATGSPENRNDAAISRSGVNPKAAVQWRANDHLSTYLSASRGFRFGGIQIVGPSTASPNVPATYSPDSLWNYELGTRTQWFGRSLQIDGAVFYIDWKDPQVNTTTGGQVPLNVIDNIEGARSYGGELALRWAVPILRGLQVDLAGAYTNARTTAAFTAPSGAVVPSGSHLPGYALSHFLGAIRYAKTIGDVALEGSIAYARQGPGVSDVQQSMKVYDYATFDIGIGIGSRAWPGQPRLTLGVINLADQRAVVSAQVGQSAAPPATTSPNFTTIYNRPRTYALRLEMLF